MRERSRNDSVAALNENIPRQNRFEYASESSGSKNCTTSSRSCTLSNSDFTFSLRSSSLSVPHVEDNSPVVQFKNTTCEQQETRIDFAPSVHSQQTITFSPVNLPNETSTNYFAAVYPDSSLLNQDPLCGCATFPTPHSRYSCPATLPVDRQITDIVMEKTSPKDWCASSENNTYPDSMNNIRPGIPSANQHQENISVSENESLVQPSLSSHSSLLLKSLTDNSGDLESTSLSPSNISVMAFPEQNCSEASGNFRVFSDHQNRNVSSPNNCSADSLETCRVASLQIQCAAFGENQSEYSTKTPNVSFPDNSSFPSTRHSNSSGGPLSSGSSDASLCRKPEESSVASGGHFSSTSTVASELCGKPEKSSVVSRGRFSSISNDVSELCGKPGNFNVASGRPFSSASSETSELCLKPVNSNIASGEHFSSASNEFFESGRTADDSSVVSGGHFTSALNDASQLCRNPEDPYVASGGQFKSEASELSRQHGDSIAACSNNFVLQNNSTIPSQDDATMVPKVNSDSTFEMSNNSTSFEDSAMASPESSSEFPAAESPEDITSLDLRRTRRISKRKREFFEFCPICGVTVRLPELQAHFAKEVEGLAKIHRNVKKPRREDKGSNKNFMQVKNNRENRLAAKLAEYTSRAKTEVQCPACSLRISGTVQDINKHVLFCLSQEENSDDFLVVDDNDDDDESFEEYEIGNETRVRAVSFMPGGYNSLQSRAKKPRSSEEDEDLNVDVDDTIAFGQPQYTELDVIPGTALDDKEQKELLQLRRAVLENSNAQPHVLESRKWNNHEDMKQANEASSGSEDQMCSKENAPGLLHEEKEKDSHPDHVMSSLKEKIRDLEEHNNKSVKCLICLEPYTKPVVSTACWHVYCEECWLMTMGMKKLCPQCNMIVSPSDLRRIYL